MLDTFAASLFGVFLLGTAAALSPAVAQPAPVSSSQFDRALADDLVAANRILFDQGIVDGYGHVSARDIKDPDHFLLARSTAPGLVTAADIMAFDRNGEAIDPQGRPVYIERFIHSEIYKARPDVKAIVHSHSPAIIPFGVTDVPLRPVYAFGAFLSGGVPIFEIRDAGGSATDMLVRNHELGAALARTLGPASVALMRGHGDVVTGDSLKQAVFRAIYTEANAKLEADALRLGNGRVTFLNDQEAAAATVTSKGIIDRAWELWKQRAMTGH